MPFGYPVVLTFPGGCADAEPRFFPAPLLTASSNARLNPLFRSNMLTKGRAARKSNSLTQQQLGFLILLRPKLVESNSAMHTLSCHRCKRRVRVPYRKL